MTTRTDMSESPLLGGESCGFPSEPSSKGDFGFSRADAAGRETGRGFQSLVCLHNICPESPACDNAATSKVLTPRSSRAGITFSSTPQCSSGKNQSRPLSCAVREDDGKCGASRENVARHRENRHGEVLSPARAGCRSISLERHALDHSSPAPFASPGSSHRTAPIHSCPVSVLCIPSPNRSSILSAGQGPIS